MGMLQNDFIGERLRSVGEMIRDGAILCDVGTDHAKLPIALVSQRRIKKAYATDINKGPIAAANKNINEMSLSDKIECILTDGLESTQDLGITDISICGMGGELIVSILSRCDYVRDSNINLVLQPMTHTEDLRRFLYDNGFVIDDELLVKETGKLYVIIRAHFENTAQIYTDIELMLGKILLSKERDELFVEMAQRALYHLKNRQKSNDVSEAEYAKKLHDEIIEVLG